MQLIKIASIKLTPIAPITYRYDWPIVMSRKKGHYSVVFAFATT